MDDGVDLAATLYEPSAAPPPAGYPAIVMFHGLGGKRQDLTFLAQALRRRSFAVLTVDARGHGESGGLVSIDGPREIADVEGVFDWLAARPEIDGRQDRRLGDLARRRRRPALARRGRALGGGRDRRDVDRPLQRARPAAPHEVRRRLRVPQLGAAGSTGPVGARDPQRRAGEHEPRRRPRLGRRALEPVAAREGDDAGVHVPGPPRLRLRHRPGAGRLPAAEGAKAPVRGRLRARAVDLPRA